MKFTRPIFCYFVHISLLLAASFPAFSTTTASPGETQLCDRIEQIHQTRELLIDGEAISATQLIPEFYDRRDFTLAWLRESNMDELMEIIEASSDEGLIPADYHLTPLQMMLADHRAGRLTTCERADLDILLTDALLRIGYHYAFGKVDPRRLDADWNLKREISGRDPVEAMQTAIDSDSLAGFLRELAPSSPLYEEMKVALARHRAIAVNGGWPLVPKGPVLKPGMQDERVAVIRQRLLITDDLLTGASPDPALYDEELKQAVIDFQERHTLDTDGIVGKSTIAAMNVPVAARIDQIRVNMERARWIYRDLPDEFIIADIAGFQAAIVKDGEITWNSAVQVGKPFRKTPVFEDTMKYIVINPTWTVPPTILAKDILPKIRKDPGYLKKKNMRVIDRNGNTIDATGIDWASTTRRNFPYMIRQDPGPKNALGRIKFMFPNKHAIYLHDTPHKSGFKHTERAFSSGCIRVQKPIELAEILLNDPEKWSQEEIRKVIDSEVTTTVKLEKQLPVFLLYWTVNSDDGIFYFKPDVYSRDPRVLAALNGKFQFDAPDNMPGWYKK